MALDVNKVEYDPFDQPIPGQGMTAPQGSRLWEQTPQEAAASIIDSIENTETAKDNMLNMIAAGSPIETIINTMAFAGFTEGKWSPDTAELIKVPLAVYLIGLAVDNGIDATIFNVAPEDRETMNESDLYKMMASHRPEQFSEMERNLEEQSMMVDEADAVEEDTAELDAVMENLPQDEGGFMPRRGAPNEMV